MIKRRVIGISVLSVILLVWVPGTTTLTTSVVADQFSEIRVERNLTVGGQIGIGTQTPSPSSLLHLTGQTPQVAMLLQNESPGGTSWQLSSLGGLGGKQGNFELLNTQFEPPSNAPRFFEGSSALSVTRQHKVGIGGAPEGESELHVWGGGEATDLFLENVNGLRWAISALQNGNLAISSVKDGQLQEILTITPDGLVGIRNQNPQAALHIEGGLKVSGPKQSAQSHPRDSSKSIVYAAPEGPEVGTYVRGSANLDSGKAVIQLPDHFNMVTADSQITVQLTPIGKWIDLYVDAKSPDRIIVKSAESQDGEFDYIVRGVRKGFEDHKVIQGKMD